MRNAARAPGRPQRRRPRPSRAPRRPARSRRPREPLASRSAAPDRSLHHVMGAEDDVRMPLTAHLEELRTCLIRSLLAIAVGFAACYGFSEPLVAFLIRPLQSIRPEQALVIGTGVTDAFFTKLKVSAVAGIFLASPAVFYQAWQFIAPGLYERERRVALPFSIAASFFFVAGAAFCYYLVFPVAFRFFLDEFTSVGIVPQIRVGVYMFFLL